MSDDRHWYEGTSDFLRWAPRVFRESMLRSAFVDRGYTVT
jgi:hypothetical protein